ncbi:MAG: SDR family oxidoreductase [Pseudomonadales bacterium]|nr:SDR family oxidoreductase [Pseudomonadales bacterium]
MPIDRTIVITGAGSGLGRAWALGFLGDGAKVIGVDINEAGLREVADAGGLTLAVDVSSEPDVKRMIDFAVERTGRIDVLFNNAGFGNNRAFADVPEGDFERHIAVHVYGTVYGMRYALPYMVDAGYGRIINTISRAAEICAPKNAAYAAAKAAIWATTRSVQAEYENEDILINMLIPGPTNTAIWGRDMPNMQSPDVTYPTAKMLATLKAGGPRGDVFWDEKRYPIFGQLYKE